MRIKIGEDIKEVDRVWIRSNDIGIDGHFYQTKEDTDMISEQLLEKGYADLSDYTTL